MGPNGQAQYRASDIAGACEVLLTYYEHAYVAPGERFPAPRATRSIHPTVTSAPSPHQAPGSDLEHRRRDLRGGHQPRSQEALRHPLGDAGVIDARPSAAGALEGDARGRDGRGLGRAPRRLAGGAAGDRVAPRAPPRARPGGRAGPVDVRARCSRWRPRRSPARSTPPPAAGRWSCWPTWPGSTAPRSRCAASSSSTAPRSRRAVVNFDGPIVFCVISRFHGGAFVVFSRALNENLESSAVEGAYASVIGGAPAAAVVFTREVDRRARADPRIVALDERIERADDSERSARRCSPSATRCGERSARRSSASSPPSSTPCTASSGRCRSARWSGSSPPRGSVRT